MLCYRCFSLFKYRIAGLGLGYCVGGLDFGYSFLNRSSEGYVGGARDEGAGPCCFCDEVGVGYLPCCWEGGCGEGL